MARPDIQIGERIFKPKGMGRWDAFKANLLNEFGMVAAELQYPYQPQYARVIDSIRLGIFYGDEAVDAFDNVVDDAGRFDPQVKLATELQSLGQPRWRIDKVFKALGRGKISPQPADLDRHEPYYRWYETADLTTQVLVPTL